MTISSEAAPCQVAVIGGGPAGCAAAHEAARLGLSGIVIERGEPWRDKVCGDMLVPGATAILKDLGIRLAEDNRAPLGSPFVAVDLRSRRGLMWRVTYPDEPVWIVRRRDLDQRLRDALPTEMQVWYAASVIGMTGVRAGLLELRVQRRDRLLMPVRSETVIIAAGARCPIASAWGVSGAAEIAPSISAYLEDDAAKIPTFAFHRTSIPGYRWVFPLSGGMANVGVCALVRTDGAALRALGNELLAERGLRPAEVRWRGGAGALWSGRGTAWHHDAGVLSCGDAAGLVDPVNGEGITAALASGRAAARAVHDFLSGGTRSRALKGYSEWLRASFAAKYRRTPVRMIWRQLCGGDRAAEKAA